jgi:hypothetical protein
MPRAVPIIGSVAVALALAAIAALSREEPARGTEQCTPLDERTKAILQGALDRALDRYVGRLFDTRAKEPIGDPTRALRGTYKAVTIYYNGTQALKLIDKVCSQEDD